MPRVTFINALTVPFGREEEFIAKWDEGARYVRTCDGFVSTSLHRSVTPGSRFSFFTVAEWESIERFQAATSSEWWREYVTRFGFGPGDDQFGAEPVICEQVR